MDGVSSVEKFIWEGFALAAKPCITAIQQIDIIRVREVKDEREGQ